jgi:predicted nucleic acid-binding protein
MRKTVYIETSIASYLAAVPSRDMRAMAWQQITTQWWSEERPKFILFTSEIVFVEAARGDAAAARRRLAYLRGIRELKIDDEARSLAERLITEGAIAQKAEVDALHVAVAAVHGIDYLLTWNCRHIDNAAMKPRMRFICAEAGFTCPEICTPLELLKEDSDDVS